MPTEMCTCTEVAQFRFCNQSPMSGEAEKATTAEQSTADACRGTPPEFRRDSRRDGKPNTCGLRPKSQASNTTHITALPPGACAEGVFQGPIFNIMSTQFNFEPATRQGIKPLVGLYGTSNSGKTYSALLLARGFAGPNGKVILGDTESGRGALYADLIPGGYLRADIEPPFSPQKYNDFLDAAEAAGANAIVIDSFSHEWEGEGGVLDWASDIEAESGKTGLHCWKKPKTEHAKLVMRLMRSKTFVILCLRAKYKSRQAKQGGKTVIVKDDHVTPIQSDDFIFELTAHAEMQPSDPGTIRLTKWSVPDLAECFPEDGRVKLGIEHGAAIASWANNPGSGKPKPQQPQRDVSSAELSAAKKRIWAAVKQDFDDASQFEQHLKDRGVLGPDESLSSLDLAGVLKVAKAMEVPL